MKVQTISRDEPGYRDIDHKLQEHMGRRVDYHSLAETYNGADKGTILLLKLHPRLRISNIAKTLTRRGLARRIDYEMARLKRDANNTPIPVDLRPVAMKKLTDKEMSGNKDVK